MQKEKTDFGITYFRMRHNDSARAGHRRRAHDRRQLFKVLMLKAVFLKILHHIILTVKPCRVAPQSIPHPNYHGPGDFLAI